MDTIGISSIYRDAIQKALGQGVRVHHFASDFDALWSDDFDPQERPVIIVWGGEPLEGSSEPNDRLLEPHLTPLDWALAWSMRQADGGKTVPAITIIDVRLDDWGGGWAWTVRHQLLADMPWVTLAAPLVRTDGALSLHRPAVSSTYNGTADGVLIQSEEGRWMLANGWEPRALADRQLRALRQLWRLWAASLNESDEHHDINNLVGARILLAQSKAVQDYSNQLARSLAVGEGGYTATVGAFLQKVAWLKDYDESGPGWTAWDNPWREEDPFFGKKLYLTIYDDQYRAGWDTFLLEFLQDISCDAAGEDSPSELVDFIKDRAVFKKRDFLMNAHAPSNGHPELIFLDFRIYPRSAREQFLQDTRALLAKAKEIASCRSLAWDAISKKEIAIIEAWLDRGAPENDYEHEQALLLLPRLLALALPLTPIVLFSSTAQARIKDQLKPYSNIFTGFQKPNPLGSPTLVQQTISALGAAMDHAIPMLRRRLQLGFIQEIFEEREKYRPKKNLPDQTHYEIFFDESGNTTITSTAVIYEFRNINEAEKLSYGIFDKCRAEGRRSFVKKTSDLLQGRTILNGPNVGRDRALAVRDIQNEAAFVAGCLNNKKGDIISIQAKRPNEHAPNLSLAEFIDTPLDEAIFANISFFLHVYTKYFSINSSVSIHIPSRRVPVNADVEDLYKLRFGMRIFKNELGETSVVTYDNSHGTQLLRGWLQTWGSFSMQIGKRILSVISKSVSARDQLAQHNVEVGSALHYVSDWAAGFVAYGGRIGNIQSQILRKALCHDIFGQVYYSRMGERNIDNILECFRSIVAEERSQMSQAVAVLCRSPFVEKLADDAAAPKILQISGKRRSVPQEHLWLWAIFPHIAQKAKGKDLVAGL
jgi:hypothetical protein